MKKLILIVAASIFAAQAFSQTIYYVSSTGTGSGTSWKTIRGAIAAAASGDIIEVAAETFTEKNIVFPTVNLVITPKSLTIKGAGIDKTIVQASATINDPAIVNGVFNFDGLYSSPITITIQDMTILNGRNALSGGGIRLINTGTIAPTLNFTNLKITNNYSNASGAGMYIGGSANTTITGCDISSNTMTNTASTSYGGGICIVPGVNKLLSAIIRNSTISFNTSASIGGGMMAKCEGDATNTNQLDHKLIIENTTVYKNSCTTAAKSGGGIVFRQASNSGVNCSHSIILNHCTIVANTTNGGSGGDGVCFDYSQAVNLTLNNSIIMGNSGATTNPCQIGFAGTPQTFTNAGITNSIFGIVSTGTWVTATTENNNKLDATIGDLAFASSLSSDATPVLKIGSTSIAKNYVTANSLSLTTDELGNTRDSNPDAGAYELPLNASVNSLFQTNFLIVKGKELQFANIEGLIQIYNVTGGLVKVQKTANSKVLLSNAGVYIVKMNTTQGVFTQKIMLY